MKGSMKTLFGIGVAFLILTLLTDPVSTSSEFVCNGYECGTVETQTTNGWWYLFAFVGGITFSISTTWFIVYSAVIEGLKNVK